MTANTSNRGDLRIALGENFHKLVVAEIDKDLTKLSTSELAIRLENIIRI
ncbi:MAG: host attachment protein [Hyphomicrobiales bacterium]|nr:host attachment protein [Hyphomicrobiales bacterium]